MSVTQSEERSRLVATTGATIAARARLGARGAAGEPTPVGTERPVFVADHPWRHRIANATLALGALLLLAWLLAIIAGAVGFGNLPALPLVPQGGSGASGAGNPVGGGSAGGGVSRTSVSTSRAGSAAAGSPPSGGTGQSSNSNTRGSQPQTGSQKVSVSHQPNAGGATPNSTVQAGAASPTAPAASPTGREPSGGTAPAAPEGRTNAPAAGGGTPTTTPTGREIPQEPQGVASGGSAGVREGAAAGEAHRTSPQG